MTTSTTAQTFDEQCINTTLGENELRISIQPMSGHDRCFACYRLLEHEDWGVVLPDSQDRMNNPVVFCRGCITALATAHKHVPNMLAPERLDQYTAMDDHSSR